MHGLDPKCRYYLAALISWYIDSLQLFLYSLSDDNIQYGRWIEVENFNDVRPDLFFLLWRRMEEKNKNLKMDRTVKYPSHGYLSLMEFTNVVTVKHVNF